MLQSENKLSGRIVSIRLLRILSAGVRDRDTFSVVGRRNVSSNIDLDGRQVGRAKRE